MPSPRSAWWERVAAFELQPEHADALRLRPDERRDPRRRNAARADEAGRAAARQHDHGKPGATNPGVLAADRRPPGPARLGASLADLVLLRNSDDRRQARLRRRNGGQLQAYDAANGNLLWSFQTGAGANSTATPFMLDGKEVLPSTPRQCARGHRHGDNLCCSASMARSDLSRPARHRPPQSRTRQSQGRLDRRSERGEFFFKLSSQREAQQGHVRLQECRPRRPRLRDRPATARVSSTRGRRRS